MPVFFDDLLDRVLDDARRDREEGERVEQARGRSSSMSSPIVASSAFDAECGENATLASMFVRPRVVQLGRGGVAERGLSLSK